jgi:drug/metabolite transporter (DMT)-like permease
VRRAGGQFLLINAFRMADASALAPIDFTRLIMAGAVGYVVFAEIPDLWTVLGSLIIAGSALLTTRQRTAPAARSRLS